MYLLLLIFVSQISVHGQPQTVVVKEYDTEKECIAEKKRIWNEMLISYLDSPDTKDEFKFMCKLKGA